MLVILLLVLVLSVIMLIVLLILHYCYNLYYYAVAIDQKRSILWPQFAVDSNIAAHLSKELSSFSVCYLNVGALLVV